MTQRRFLCFRIADRRLALPLDAIRYAAPIPLLKPPLAAPHFVEGYFDFQGTLLAAIRLDRLLGLGEAKLGIYAPLLILADAEPGIALHVEVVEAILKVSDSATQPIDGGDTFNGCVAGRFTDRADTIYVLDADRLLLAAEREKLAAHRQTMQRRLEALSSDATHAG